MTRIAIFSALLLLISGWASAQALQVRHDHNPRGKCEGELLVTEEGIEYRTEKEKHQRRWSWVEIQSFDRRSDSEFSLLSYEDQRWVFGADRPFNFSVLPGQSSLDETTFQLISARLRTPVVDRVSGPPEADYQVQVKHLHTFGGCQGTLYFGPEKIVYRTDHTEDSRSWRRDREVESVWSLGDYHLEIHVFENSLGSFDKTRRFRFQLKEPLDRDYYDRLRREFLGHPLKHAADTTAQGLFTLTKSPASDILGWVRAL